MIAFSCPQCGTNYELEDELLGAKVQCAVCNLRFFAPQTGCVATICDDEPDEPVVDNTSVSFVQEEDLPQNKGEENKIVISFDDIPSSPSPMPSSERKLSPRQRRLFSDHKMMIKCFSSFPYINLEQAIGNPPEKYIVNYFVRGIERLEGDRIIYRNNHRVEIVLPGTYPRTPPTCRMLTPIFHPNIEPAVICIGDHWTAGERLCDLVVRIGEIITYQSYNIKSPLDGEAAMWADLHQDFLPIDKTDLMPPEL